MNVVDPDHVKKALPYAVFNEEIAKYREMKKKRRKGVRKENDLNTTAENVELCSSNNGVEPVSHCEKASTTAQKDKDTSTQPQFEITIKDLDEEETSLTEKQTTSEQNNTVHAKMGSNSDKIQTRRPTTSKNSQLEQSRKQEAKSKVGKASSIENRNPKQVQLRKHSNTECSSIKQLEVDNPTDKPMTIRRENEKPVALALHSRYKTIKQGEPKGNIVDPVVPKSLSESINKPTHSLESKSEMRLAENPKAIQLSIPNNASELANQRQQVPSTSQKDIHMESKAARNLNKTDPPNTGNQPRGKQNNEVLGKTSGNASQMQKINTTFKSRELPKEIKKQKATNMVEKAIPIGNFNPKQVQLKAQLKTELSSRNQLETDNDNKTQSVCGVKTTVKIASIQREKPPEQPIVAISPSGSKHKPTHLLESRSEITSKATGTSHMETETGRKETAISTLWEDDDMIIITPRTELEQIEVMDSITALLSDERFSQPNNHGRSMAKIPLSNSESENSINQQLDEDEDVIIIDCDIKTKNPVNSSVDEENILEVVDLDNDPGVAGSSNKTNLNDSISEDDDDVIISAISLSMDLLNAEHNSHTQNVMGGVERTVNSIERIPNKCMNSDQRKLLLQTMAKRNALKAEKIKLLDQGKRSLTEYRRKKLDLYLRKANAIEKEARLAKAKSIKALVM